jgi:regulation of enolase protein 1 (concanavalin A-like superfamily)
MLQEISRDFTIQVKVSGDFTPGKLSTGVGKPFVSAGILLWQDENNYLRVERNAYWAGPGRLVCYPPLIEYFYEGREKGFTSPTSADYFKGRSTWLRLTRMGETLTVSISFNGSGWFVGKRFSADLADDVLVGVSAINTSDEPFTVEFEDLQITSPPEDNKPRPGPPT